MTTRSTGCRFCSLITGNELTVDTMHAVRQLMHSPLAVSVLLCGLVWLGIIGLRSAGALVSLELEAYDGLLRTRLGVPVPDARIVLITIADRDIDKLGQWPMSDQTLAQVLAMLSQEQPQAIGLDLYRDVPVPPGREAFEAVLTDNPHIVAIMNFGADGADGIPPPSVLSDTEQVGFNDVVIDRDGLVRRGLLFLDDGENVFYAFALRLALLYLQQEGMAPEADPANPSNIRLGKSTIRPFKPYDGGYVAADAQGYQFLLDFLGAPQPFPSFSLTSLLAGEVPPEAIRNKIILLGVTVTEGVKDFFFTPYRHGPHADQRMAGITLHAHAVSQLLRAALTGNGAIVSLSHWQEAL